MGVPAIIIYGDPHNYCKHGFKNGIDYRVSNMEGEYPLGLLVLELNPGFFGDKKWKIMQSDAFNIDQDEANKFDKRFRFPFYLRLKDGFKRKKRNFIIAKNYLK